MPEPTDDELIEVLRDTPGQPTPRPARCKAWDVPRLSGAVFERFGGERSQIEERLDRLVVQLGGGREVDVYPAPETTGPARPTVQRDTYWVDKNQLDWS